MSLFNRRMPRQLPRQQPQQQMTQEQARQQVQARQPMPQPQPVQNNRMRGDIGTAMQGFLKKSGQQKVNTSAPPGSIIPQQLTPEQAKAMETQRTTYNPNPMNLGPSDIPLDGYPQNTSRNPMYDPFNPLDNSPAVASPMGTTGTGGGTTQTANPLQGSSGMGVGASNAAYMAKGGKVKSKAKVKKYAKGGSVSSASKRADGCATKGRTKGRIY
jgi:hypothetical protein